MHGELAFTHYTAVRIGGQKPTGTLVQSPSLIDHGRHGMAMFLELSSYIYPRSATHDASCLLQSLRLAGARQVDALLDAAID